MSNGDYFAAAAGIPPAPSGFLAPAAASSAFAEAPPTAFGASPVLAASPTASPTSPVQGHGRSSRRAVVVGSVVAALVLAAVGIAHLRTPPRDDRPIVFPTTLADLQPAPAATQFGAQKNWLDMEAKLVGDRRYAGRSYGGAKAGRLINVVVVRGDTSDVGDPGAARPPYTDFGPVRCTHSMQFDGLVDPKVMTMDRWVLCWRARDTLTVSVFVVLGGQGFDEQAAQAVQQIWDLEG